MDDGVGASIRKDRKSVDSGGIEVFPAADLLRCGGLSEDDGIPRWIELTESLFMAVVRFVL